MILRATRLLKTIAILFFDKIDILFHQKRILSFLKKNKLNINFFIDVGSHKGTYTDLIINNFSVKKILMFEPQKNIYQFIKKKYNKKKYIKIFNRAASNDSSTKKIYINKHDLTSSLSPLKENNLYLKLKAILFAEDRNRSLIKKIDKIKTIQIKQILKKIKLKKIDLMKIDTEGHEFEVLRGIDNYLNKVHYLLIEFHLDKIYFNYNPNKIHNYLIKNNFILKETLKFPLTNWEDRIYINKNFK